MRFSANEVGVKSECGYGCSRRSGDPSLSTTDANRPHSELGREEYDMTLMALA